MGPFFDVHRHQPGERPVEPWRPMAELVDGGDALPRRVAAVRAGLGERAGTGPDRVELRVAASVAQLGLVARLVTPVFARSSPADVRLAWDDVWWQPVLGGPFPLSLPAGRAPSPGRVLDGPVADLVAAVHERFGVSTKVLWGNAGSAVNGVANVAPTLRDAVADALQHPRIRIDGAGVGPAYRRRSCCLIYRAAPGRRGPLCGDCVLVRSRSG